MKKIVIILALLLLAALPMKNASASVPFLNLEGVGGYAFNPVAYLAEGDSDYKIGDVDVIGKPRFGTWYANLPNNGDKIDWGSYSVADTLFKRLEISDGYEVVALTHGNTYHKNNLGAKIMILDENAFGTKWVPAISVGTIFGDTTHKYVSGLRSSGEDGYVVVSKTVTQLPLPVIFSGGMLSSQELVTGALGYDNKRKSTGFGNIDIVLPHNFVVGYEIKQGEHFAAFKNQNYYETHLAWMANKNLTFIAAYINTGDPKSTRVGLGSGFTLSAQYAF